MPNEKGYIGTAFGNYRVIAELGSGGFGKVYQGVHTILTERAVAIKLLHAHLGEPEERERFLEEARLLERLKHPYIVHIFDVGIHEGFPYLVAEYAPHGSLRNLIKRYAPHPVPTNIALNVLTQIGQALSYAHQRNIIHRDLKPENILFNAQGEALLADFGIATTLSTSSVKYATIIGTPSYMAPEQFQSTISKESDQYALACIAYELFTGQLPFTATDFFSIGFQHIDKPPMALTQLNANLPPHVEQAILKAMAKQRHARHADINAFITALHTPIDAPAQSPLSATLVPHEPTALITVSSLATPSVPLTILNAVDAFNRSTHASASLGVKDLQNAHKSYQQIPETPLPFVYPSSLDTTPVHNASLYHQGPITPLPPTPVSSLGAITQTVHPVKQRKGRYPWLLIAVAALLVAASLLSVHFFAFPPKSTPILHITPVANATSVLSPIASTVHTVLTPVSTTTTKPSPGVTTTSTSLTTATSIPTATATRLPTTETFLLYFINGTTATSTTHSYSGKVTIHVTGAGEEYTNKWLDAFYQYTDAHGNQITPVHTSTYPGWTLWINGGVADNYVNPIPSYRSYHDYTFTITAPGGFLTFAIGDTYAKDNSGYLTVTVTQG